MFGFFNKNKKNNTGSELANHYESLLKNYRENYSQTEQKANNYIKQYDYSNPMDWMDALAICDVALEKKALTDTIKELYRQIYSNSWNKYVAMDFNDTDYEFWFNLNVKINDRFISAGHYRGYAEQADLYSSVRRPYRSFEKEKEYYLKGVEHNDATSMGCYGYNLYYGLREYGEADKSEGLRLMQRSKELGYESADILLLHLKFYDSSDEDKESLLSSILEHIEQAADNRKPYYLLADYYLRQNNLPEAVEAMKKGIAVKDKNSEYLYGMQILRGNVENVEKAEGIKHLEISFKHYVVYSANFLGQYYYYANDENTSVEKAIEWHQKADLYYSADSAFELAVIYAYNDQVKDQEKAMFYLNQAIAEGHHRSMAEKAYLLLEGENRTPEAVAEAQKLLTQAMDLGNDYAPYRLGLAAERGEFGEASDYAKALELYNTAAERGNVMGMEAAGHYYRCNYASEDEGNIAKAIDLFNRAIERNSSYARVELALCYESGDGIEKDYKKAFDLYEQAAAHGYPYANLKMAYYYEDALVGEEDFTKALENFKIASEGGNAEATYNVGRYYRYAVGIPENPQEAIRNFMQASEAGNGQAMIEMALVYEYEYGGYGFDAQKATEYMTKAAEQGYSYAQYKVGYYLYYGLLEQDIQKGKEWFEKSYEAGYPHSAIMLGNYYLYNHGGEKDYAKSFDYYRFAQERDVLTEGLGICYEFGFGVDENETEAIKYYTLAAEKENTASMYRLGLCYKYGTGTAENLSESYNWFTKAAENEHFNAQYEVAMMLLDGKGVAQDEERAVQMLMKIAEEDHDDAQFELGNCYLTGRGVQEDDVQAMVWYQKAADNGNEEAKKLTGRRDRSRR